MGINQNTIFFNLLKFVLSPFLHNSKLLSLLSFASILILFQVSSPLILNAFRAEEKPVWYCSANIANKYLGLILGLLFLLITTWRLYGFYTGIIIGEGIVFLFLISVWLYRYGKKIFHFSKPIFLKTFKYGFPLLGLNISGFISNNGDRYLIQYFLGTEKVAVYSVGYSLCTYVQNLFLTPINMALIPICMSLWESKKTEETKQFLSRFIGYFAMIAIPLIFGLSAIGKEAIILLASAKYKEAAVVIPTVIAGVICSGVYFPVMAGLFLEKRTGWVASLMFISALSNTILNIILIPQIGILGAAWATLLSFLVYIVLGRIVSKKYLAPAIPYNAMLKYSILSLIMFIAVKMIHFDFFPNVLLLILKISVGIITYGILLFVFDKETRDLIRKLREYVSNKIPFLTFLKPSTEKP